MAECEEELADGWQDVRENWRIGGGMRGGVGGE